MSKDTERNADIVVLEGFENGGRANGWSRVINQQKPEELELATLPLTVSRDELCSYTAAQMIAMDCTPGKENQYDYLGRMREIKKWMPGVPVVIGLVSPTFWEARDFFRAGAADVLETGPSTSEIWKLYEVNRQNRSNDVSGPRRRLSRGFEQSPPHR